MSSINAQVSSPTSPRSSNAEFRMLGITLYQTGKQVIAKYGTPIEILALGSGGGGAAGPAGGSNNPGAGGAPGGRPGGGGGGGGGGSSLTPLIYRPGDIIGDPFDTGETAFRQFNPDDSAGGPQGPKSSGNGNAGPSGAGGGGGGGGATGTEGNIIFTRWVYKRGASQYAFLFDKANRVVQIEAIGLKDGNVKTRNGTTFGATFGQLIKMYGAPDGYEINGQTIVVKYLVQRRVAFRLTRLVPNQLHKVTGIVIAAGKG